MKRRLLTLCAMMALLVMLGTGCAGFNPKYQNYVTYAQTRKIVDSPTPAMYKAVFAPIMFVPETVLSPFMAYIDAGLHPPESKDKHVYLSYVGFKTMNRAMGNPEVRSCVLYMSMFIISIIDTAWLPIAGLVDTGYIITRPTPESDFSTHPSSGSE